MTYIFKNKKLNIKNLLNYGFVEGDEGFSYSCELLSGDFKLLIKVQPPNVINTTLIDIASDDVYTLHLTETEGSFVGQIRDEYNEVLQDISDKCFEADVFKSEFTLKLIEYIRDKYSGELEFLWEKFAGNAVVRRADNKKWYAAFLTVNAKKLGLKEEKQVEIIDLRAVPEELPELLKQDNIYPGYHMNKKHWITILLDNSNDITKVFSLIDKSYGLAKKK